MNFQLLALDPAPFRALFGLSDETLATRGVEAMIAVKSPGFPCRVSLRDAAVGARVLLLNYEHLSGPTPYRARHAIFVQEDAERATPEVNEVGPYLSTRLLSVRAFDNHDRMRDADVCEGADASTVFRRLLADPEVSYLHAHAARQGCYLARVDRVA